MASIGRCIFIDEIQACEGGDVQAIAAQADQGDVSFVVFKIADGLALRNETDSQDVHLVRALRKTGVQAWGWQYVYGYNPFEEAGIAIQRVQELQLDGFVFFAASTYKESGDAAAKKYITLLRTEFADLPIAMSSYRFPSEHPALPWAAFLDLCDYNMPYFFWGKDHKPGDQLNRSHNEFNSLNPCRPVIPIGSVFAVEERQPSFQEIKEFLETAQSLKMDTVGFWTWDFADTEELNLLWEVISDHQKKVFDLGDPVIANYMAALNSRKTDRIMAMYAKNAVHINADRLIKGSAEIRSHYEQLFTQILPKGEIVVDTFKIVDNVRYVKWVIRSKPDSNPIDQSSKTNISKDEFEQLFQGVYYKKQKKSLPREHSVHIMYVDLNDPDIDLVVTPREDLGSTTSQFLERHGLQVAVNGDAWLAHDNPKGLAISQGDRYSEPSPEPTVYISKGNRVQIGTPRPSVLWNAISGSHRLVKGGKVSRKIRTCAKSEIYSQKLEPWSSIGITEDNHLIIVVTEGPPLSPWDALTLEELASLFLDLGAKDAICLDGGGSSTLVVENPIGPRVLNVHSDSTERKVSNHLGIFAKESKPGSENALVISNDTFGLMDTFNLKSRKILYHFQELKVKQDADKKRKEKSVVLPPGQKSGEDKKTAYPRKGCLKEKYTALRLRSKPTTKLKNTIGTITGDDLFIVHKEIQVGDDLWWFIELPDMTVGWGARRYQGVVYLEWMDHSTA